jgi:phosphoribosylformylglycinamidine synthase
MARQPGGACLDLTNAPLKYQGLAPWEILVSEAQERMTLAVPPDQLPALLELARLREVEATDLGVFTNDGHLEVRFDGRVVALLPLDFLHEGDPVLRIEAEWSPPAPVAAATQPRPVDGAAGAALLGAFLSRDNLRSAELLARTYDHEVKALSVVKPWVGLHRDVPSDASVFLVAHDAAPHGYAVSEAVFPTYSDHDAHAMAQAGVDLAVRRVVAAGARTDRIAALDNYCWPDPLPGASNPDAKHKAAQLVRASKGLHEICVAYGVPLISGKDSMKNDAVVGGKRISIPPTLLASAIAIVPDVRRAVTLEAAVVGEVLILVGDTREELGGTEWALAHGLAGGEVPRCRPAEFWPRYEAVGRAIRDELVVAAHAIGRGGLATALFLMARASGLGLGTSLTTAPVAPGTSWEGLLYGETPGRFLLACRPERMDRLRKQLGHTPHAVIGSFTASQRLKISLGDASLVDAPVADLTRAWKREGGAA